MVTDIMIGGQYIDQIYNSIDSRYSLFDLLAADPAYALDHRPYQ